MNGRVAEEVDEFYYLGFWLNYNRGHEFNVSRRVERTNKVLGQVWGIGKERFKND